MVKCLPYRRINGRLIPRARQNKYVINKQSEPGVAACACNSRAEKAEARTWGFIAIQSVVSTRPETLAPKRWARALEVGSSLASNTRAPYPHTSTQVHVYVCEHAQTLM